MATSKRPDQKPSVKNWGLQADKMLARRFLDLSSRHAAKQAAGIKGNKATGGIHSIATLRKYSQSLKNAGEWIGPKFGISRLDKITTEHASAYLSHRAHHGIGQKQLDADRTALHYLRNVDELDRVLAEEPRKLEPRAYTPAQIQIIAAHQSERNSLATELSYRTGLRAHELLTLQRGDDGVRSDYRAWRDDLFHGRAGKVYLVTGKGGLIRQIMVPNDLARRLERCRLDTPRTLVDRHIRYDVRYDIGGGMAWSQSVRSAAISQFGWSTGAHGLRHSYAQARIEELQRLGYLYRDAETVVSQEMGHFRPDVVRSYLR